MNADEHGSVPGTRDGTPDGACTTLHIRCGSDIRDSLRSAGFVGDFLEDSDPLCQGPVPCGAGLLEKRATFLAAAFGGSQGFTESQALARLRSAQLHLQAAHRFERVVLWFEHDSHDQLILARCLAQFADGPRPAHLELICIDRHPSVERFIGLGQLSPEALASLWPQRLAVTQAQLDLGRAVWAALRRSDPTDLAAIAAAGTAALPLAAPALRRHLQELPWVGDGLSLTERLVLRILSDAPERIGRMFGMYMQHQEPLPFLGDLGFLFIVEQMALARPEVITIEAADKPFPRVASITDVGRGVLAGRIDYLSLGPPERWVGGVAADGRWRWDEAAGGIVPRSPRNRQ